MNNILKKDNEKLRKYLLAGKCIFTLNSTKINKRYTYLLQKDKRNEDRYFAKVLIGDDNENDYRFIGYFYKDTLSLRTSTAAHLPHTAPQFVMLQYFLRIVAQEIPWPNTCEFYPSLRCARCGRLLTTPESIEQGLGPECMARFK